MDTIQTEKTEAITRWEETLYPKLCAFYEILSDNFMMMYMFSRPFIKYKKYYFEAQSIEEYLPVNAKILIHKIEIEIKKNCQNLILNDKHLFIKKEQLRGKKITGRSLIDDCGVRFPATLTAEEMILELQPFGELLPKAIKEIENQLSDKQRNLFKEGISRFYV